MTQLFKHYPLEFFFRASSNAHPPYADPVLFGQFQKCIFDALGFLSPAFTPEVSPSGESQTASPPKPEHP